jgi:hypothetical protein
MDRNNPVWREYLKAIIRIQLDAGADGIQLDEAELPMGAFQYGACFCKDCMKGFRAYLQALPAERLDPAIIDADLDAFHYGEWLLERGYDFKENQESTPLFGQYYRYQCAAIKEHFGELAAYARDYGREIGRDVLVSGNFFNCNSNYLALVDDVDLVITEMRNTTYRQPEWYRYVAGFAGDKEVIVVENPYGGVVPDLVESLSRGRGRDLMRLSLYEGAAFGVNMSAPYGSWMGATIQDSFYAPHDLLCEVQQFLAANDRLFARSTYHEVAVVYSVESAQALVSQADAGDNLTNATDASVRVPYRVVVKGLADAGVPFDVVVFPDGVTAPDRVDLERLSGYSTLILPDCHFLTDRQADALSLFLDAGGQVVALERIADNLEPARRAALESDPGMRRASLDDVPALTPDSPQAHVSADLAVNVARLADGAAAAHLVDYAYDAAADSVPAQSNVDLTVRLPFEARSATLIGPEHDPVILDVSCDGGVHSVRLPYLRLYGIVVFEGDQTP